LKGAKGLTALLLCLQIFSASGRNPRARKPQYKQDRNKETKAKAVLFLFLLIMILLKN
jgi:hypothetical protein